MAFFSGGLCLLMEQFITFLALYGPFGVDVPLNLISSSSNNTSNCALKHIPILYSAKDDYGQKLAFIELEQNLNCRVIYIYPRKIQHLALIDSYIYIPLVYVIKLNCQDIDILFCTKY